MLLSVITPTRNSEKFLSECMDSVASQCLIDMKYEHIIIDSGSTDKTMAIATSYKNVSFIEAGQANACESVNIGIKNARGHFIFLLMSDDQLNENAFTLFKAALGDDANFGFYLGSMDVIQEKNGVFKKTDFLDARVIFKKNQISLYRVLRNAPLVGASFIRKNLIQELGYFNTNYPLSNDREFMANIAIKGVTVFLLEQAVTKFRVHDTSTTSRPDFANVCTYLKEHIRWANYLAQNANRRTWIVLKIWQLIEIFRYFVYWLKATVFACRP